MIDWNIQSRAHACQACARPFLDKQAYHTLLFSERTGYHRLDVCEPCWTTQFSQGATNRKGFVSHWQGVFEVPGPRPEPIQRETAESLLRRLAQENDPRHGAACFILAVMLERKRLLKVRDQAQRDGRRIFIYEQPRTGEVFTIADPDLRLDQLEDVQRDVAALLEHGLPPVAGPGTAAAPDESGAPEAVPQEAEAPSNPGEPTVVL
jgi:hypothetical protein